MDSRLEDRFTSGYNSKGFFLWTFYFQHFIKHIKTSNWTQYTMRAKVRMFLQLIIYAHSRYQLHLPNPAILSYQTTTLNGKNSLSKHNHPTVNQVTIIDKILLLVNIFCRCDLKAAFFLQMHSCKVYIMHYITLSKSKYLSVVFRQEWTLVPVPLSFVKYIYTWNMVIPVYCIYNFQIIHVFAVSRSFGRSVRPPVCLSVCGRSIGRSFSL